MGMFFADHFNLQPQIILNLVIAWLRGFRYIGLILKPAIIKFSRFFTTHFIRY